MLATLLALVLAAQLALPSAGGAGAEEQVAIVLWVDGAPTITPRISGAWGAGGPTARRRLREGDALLAGRVVTLAAGDRLEALVHPEQLVVLSQPGDYHLQSDRFVAPDGPEPLVRGLPGVRQGPHGRLVASTIALPEADDPGLRLIGPRNTMVRDARPQVRWEVGNPGGRFQLAIRSVDRRGEEHEIESWTGLAGRGHLPWRDLRPGGTYRVRVERVGSASSGPSLADDAWLRVLTPTERDAAEAALDAWRAAFGDDSRTPSAQVIRAILLESYGLAAEAEAVWRELAEAHPERRGVIAHRDRLRQRDASLPDRVRYELPLGLGVYLPQLTR